MAKIAILKREQFVKAYIARGNLPTDKNIDLAYDNYLNMVQGNDAFVESDDERLEINNFHWYWFNVYWNSEMQSKERRENHLKNTQNKTQQTNRRADHSQQEKKRYNQSNY